MNQSENINELASSLAKAQGEMQAAIKDSINPFFKSKYADLGSIWDAARPVLSKNGLCVIQCTEIVGDKVVLVTTLAHSSGQWVKSYLPLNPSKNDSQGVGAAITYLRRYSLSALVGVVCDEDDDGETAMGRGKTLPKTPQEKPAEPVIPKPSQKQIEDLNLLWTKTDKEFKNAFSKFMNDSWNCEKIEQFSLEQHDLAVRYFTNNIKLN